jgi:integrase
MVRIRLPQAVSLVRTSTFLWTEPSSTGGPKHVVKTGRTPVLEGEEWRKLLDSIPATTLRDLRDRALIATLTYSFARISAALKMKVEDLRPRGASWTIPLHEKAGKQHAVPCHHALAEAARDCRSWERIRAARSKPTGDGRLLPQADMAGRSPARSYRRKI